MTDTQAAIVTDSGEVLYEMIGAGREQGNCRQQSLACSVIPPGKYSAAHFHKRSTEILYVLEGSGQMTINGSTFELKSGDACLLEPNELHSLRNSSATVNLKLLAITTPAWTAADVFSKERVVE